MRRDRSTISSRNIEPFLANFLPGSPMMSPLTLHGFYISWFVQLLEVYSYFVLFVAINSLHIGLCSYPNAIVDDFQLSMKHIERISMNIYQHDGLQRHSRRIKAMLVDAVKLHMKLIR